VTLTLIVLAVVAGGVLSWLTRHGQSQLSPMSAAWIRERWQQEHSESAIRRQER
jgi:hypothetical protein